MGRQSAQGKTLAPLPGPQWDRQAAASSSSSLPNSSPGQLSLTSHILLLGPRGEVPTPLPAPVCAESPTLSCLSCRPPCPLALWGKSAGTCLLPWPSSPSSSSIFPSRKPSPISCLALPLLTLLLRRTLHPLSQCASVHLFVCS